MHRSATVAVLLGALALAGCSKSEYGRPGALYATQEIAPPEAGRAQRQAFSYSHTIGLEMKRDAIAARYERARNRCLQDAELRCTLISASIRQGNERTGQPSEAQIVVRLPHAAVATFQKSLVDPVTGEDAGDVTEDFRATVAENVTQEAADIDAELARLNDFRTRLDEVLKRGGLGADELIKVLTELSKVQGEIRELTARKSEVDERIATERVTVMLGERYSDSDAARPIARVWQDSVQILGNSAASALQFLIAVIPWTPIIIGFVWLIVWMVRRLRRKRATATA